jgi:hypothetical protein
MLHNPLVAKEDIEVAAAGNNVEDFICMACKMFVVSNRRRRFD